jgi:hypothetical protein
MGIGGELLLVDVRLSAVGTYERHNRLASQFANRIRDRRHAFDDQLILSADNGHDIEGAVDILLAVRQRSVMHVHFPGIQGWLSDRQSGCNSSPYRDFTFSEIDCDPLVIGHRVKP